MALILNIETSSDICSISLSNNGKLISHLESSEKNSHSALISLFINDIIKKLNSENKQLDAVAFSEGPGSYTGLRIGLSAAKAICFAYDIPLINIPTLKIITTAAIKQISNPDDFLFCPMIDARRMDVYDALYNKDLAEIVTVNNKTISPETYSKLLENNKVLFFGSGSAKLKTILNDDNAYFSNIFLSSKYMVELANTFYSDNQITNLYTFVPNYIKNFQVSF